MCQPGLPGPKGASQEGSPGLAAFHRAKSFGERFSPTRFLAEAPSPVKSNYSYDSSVKYLNFGYLNPALTNVGTSKYTLPFDSYA